MTRRARRDTQTDLYAYLFSRVCALALSRARSKDELPHAMRENLRRFQSLQAMNEERLREAQERGRARDVRILSAVVAALKREIAREVAIVGPSHVREPASSKDGTR